MIGDNYQKIAPFDRWIFNADGGLAGASVANRSNNEARFLTNQQYAQVAALLAPQSSIMFIGDSLTAYGAANRNVLLPAAAMAAISNSSLTNINASGLFVRQVQADMRYTPTSAGTLKYYTADTTMSWTSAADAEGPRVSVATGGSFYLPSATTALGGVYVQIVASNKPAGDASDAVSFSAFYTNAWDYTNGFTGMWELLNGNPFDTSYNFGISGCTSTDVLAWQAQWNTIFTDITVINIGTNDNPTIANLSTTLANIQNIVRQRQAIGSIPIVMLLFPNAVDNLTQKRADLDLNLQLANWCRTNGVRFCDSYQLLSDWTTQNPGVRTKCFGSDNIHTTTYGAYLVAKYALGPVLNPLLNVLPQRIDANSAYDSSLAPHENLLSNGALAGTGGTAGAGASGTIPTGWTVSRSTGATAVVVSTAPAAGSPVTRTDGPSQPWWRLAIDNTGGPAGDACQAAPTTAVSGSNYAVGDRIVLSGEMRVAVTAGTGIQNILIDITGAAFSHQVTSATAAFEAYDFYGETLQFTFRSRPLIVPAGGLVSTLNVRLKVFMQAASSANIDLGPVALRKI